MMYNINTVILTIVKSCMQVSIGKSLIFTILEVVLYHNLATTATQIFTKKLIIYYRQEFVL